MKRTLLLSCFVCFYSLFLQGGNDSLRQILKSRKDTARIFPLLRLSENLIRQEDPASIGYAEEALNISLQHNRPEEAIIACNLIGNFYNGTGNYSKALEYLYNGLGIAEENSAPDVISNVANNIANAYLGAKDFPKAKKFYEKSYHLAEESGDPDAIAIAATGLGNIYQETGELKKSIVYLEKSLEAFEKLGNMVNYGITMHNYAEALEKDGQGDRANRYFDSALQIISVAGYQYAEGMMLTSRAERRSKQGDYTAALEDMERSEKLLREVNAMDNLKEITFQYAGILSEAGRNKEAYEKLLFHLGIKDSITGMESEKLREELTARYENAEKEKEISLLNKEKEMQSLDLNRQKSINNLTIAAGGLLLLLAGFAYNGYRTKKKANTFLGEQKAIIEEKNREITDSIRYAKLIQDAVFPPESELLSALPEHFVLFRPKDIVSGDFYWLARTENATLLSVADCTGHGVPGAMMSMVGSHGLNHAVHNLGLTKPAAILDAVNEHLRLTLKQKSSAASLKDGMDLGLCCLMPEGAGLRLLFSGANNPLWVIRKNEDAVIELKGTRQPVGSPDSINPFSEQEILLNKGDIFYLFSDGYVDQFGGDKGKKLKYRQMREWLISIKSLPMKDQKEKLESFFDAWKGNLEQVDDICLIGIRV